MHQSIVLATEYIQSLSHALPLTWFLLIGSFIEEIISPIPSALITTIAGSIAAGTQRTYFFLFCLSFLGAVGKTLASYIFYVLADKLEDLFTSKFGPFLGISHEDIESIGKKLTKDWRDDVVVFSLRAIPIAPTAAVSVVCGLIKMNLRSFLIMTCLGYTVRIFLLLFIAYTGVDVLQSLQTPLVASLSLIGGMIATGVISAGFVRFMRTRKHSHTERAQDA